MSKPGVGIDLGTTYSVVACYRNGVVEIIANEGDRTTPSIVAFTDTEILVGKAASYQSFRNPENTIYSIKRLIGRAFNDPKVQEKLINKKRKWPFQVIEEDEKIKINVLFKNNTKKFNPVQISALILRKMKKTAETYLGVPVTDVVVTCPAYFNDAQRQATKDAATIAGLNVIRLINESSSAAMAYGLYNYNAVAKNILVFDFGGGTFDVSVLVLQGQTYEVRAINGNTDLGGDDLDDILVDHFVEEFKENFKRDITNDKKLMDALKNRCEGAKRILSTAEKVDIYLDGTELSGSITRPCFENLCFDLFEKCIELVEKVLKDAKMLKNQINEVILVGGSSRIPKVKKMLQDYFDGIKLCETVNPDEAVAYGAAILAESIQNPSRGFYLHDVCPLSLGIKLIYGAASVVIERNTPIPTKQTASYSTTVDNQQTAEIEVYEGERALAEDNHFLGKFVLDKIPKAPRGATVLCTFEVDLNGILKVTAIEPKTGRSRDITISNKSLLTRQEAERIAQETERFHAEDEMHRQRVKAFNIFEEHLYNLKREVNKLKSDKKTVLEEKIREILEWLKKNPFANTAQIKQKTVELKKSFECLDSVTGSNLNQVNEFMSKILNLSHIF